MARQQATPKTPARAAKAMRTTTTPDANEGTEATAAPFDREQAIREAAYACYEARGGEPGHELDDWLTAEAQVQLAHDNPDFDSGVEQVRH